MATITLTNAPEKLAARWEQLPEEKRDIYALADLIDEYEFQPTSDEDLKSIGRGPADAEAGRVVDGETFFRELEALRQSLLNTGSVAAFLIYLFAIGFGLAGCSQETINSAKRDVDRNTADVRKGVQQVEEAAKPVIEAAKPVVGPLVDAAKKEVDKKAEQVKIGARVTAALKANENLPTTIRVDADDDAQGVKLRGTVQTDHQKKLAEKIARQTLGPNKKVQNDLKIGPAPTPSPE